MDVLTWWGGSFHNVYIHTSNHHVVHFKYLTTLLAIPPYGWKKRDWIMTNVIKLRIRWTVFAIVPHFAGSHTFWHLLLHFTLKRTLRYYPHFVDEKTGSETLRSLSKVTEPGSGRQSQCLVLFLAQSPVPGVNLSEAEPDSLLSVAAADGKSLWIISPPLLCPHFQILPS